MAGRGPAPKDPKKRARQNKQNIEQREIVVSFVPQPALQDIYGNTNPATEEPWTTQTLKLWATLADFPPLKTQGLQETQWLDLARTMILDDQFNRGNTRVAAERRLELAQYGITPDSLARHRITMATADEAEDKRRSSKAAADVRGRYRSLRAVD
ncbi:hypothetical protein [Corynebacterium amycolatum]|uniref:phage terminase small subunit n=1 Tax=Corynebacterium amycolatum TaxID=43765 RepID=UPI00191DFE0B|nr:hypothetical protein [Corynebacterium amycolatum]QQU97795.1 hypothetical protein I6I65_10760 [Corynebacterium amycolatum]